MHRRRDDEGRVSALEKTEDLDQLPDQPAVTTAEVLHTLWRDYVATTPQAERIHRLLGERGERVINDHVALRTFALPGIGIEALAKPFEAAGWQMQPDRYRFHDKKLDARFLRHPDPAVPKVFISELRATELSASAFQIIDQLTSQLPAKFGERPDLPWAGRPWTVRRAEYESLLHESEYAAWVAAFGFRVNHFTVFVNALTTFPDLQSLNAFLLDHGFTLNEAGGVIKGTPAQCLEQSSTRADSIEVELAGEMLRVPSCYYEFARRYPLASGELFQGFVPASADKIFESTDVAPKS
jgi:hypothetical protein